MDFNIDLVLKKELGFVLTEEEQQIADEMSAEEFSLCRKKVLELVQLEQKLPLDQLEERIYVLRDEEYRRLLRGMQEEDIESKMEVEASLDKKCNQMIINIATGKSNSESLLGPSIRETYGIGAKS